jgi:hypothetical protein
VPQMKWYSSKLKVFCSKHQQESLYVSLCPFLSWVRRAISDLSCPLQTFAHFKLTSSKA